MRTDWRLDPYLTINNVGYEYRRDSEVVELFLLHRPQYRRALSSSWIALATDFERTRTVRDIVDDLCRHNLHQPRVDAPMSGMVGYSQGFAMSPEVAAREQEIISREREARIREGLDAMRRSFMNGEPTVPAFSDPRTSARHPDAPLPPTSQGTIGQAKETICVMCASPVITQGENFYTSKATGNSVCRECFVKLVECGQAKEVVK